MSNAFRGARCHLPQNRNALRNFPRSPVSLASRAWNRSFGAGELPRDDATIIHAKILLFERWDGDGPMRWEVARKVCRTGLMGE